jgi:hypothetical protein
MVRLCGHRCGPPLRVKSRVNRQPCSCVDFQRTSDDIKTMVGQSPSLELVREAIEAHLSPSVHLQSLPRALELLAHIALLADKLQQEITRVLHSDARNDPDSEYAELSDKAGMRLRTYAAEAERASRRLWQISVDLRLNVSCEASVLNVPADCLAYRRSPISREEGIRQDPIPHRMLFPSTSNQGWAIVLEKDLQILEIVYSRHARAHCTGIRRSRDDISRMVYRSQ